MGAKGIAVDVPSGCACVDIRNWIERAEHGEVSWYSSIHVCPGMPGATPAALMGGWTFASDACRMPRHAPVGSSRAHTASLAPPRHPTKAQAQAPTSRHAYGHYACEDYRQAFSSYIRYGWMIYLLSGVSGGTETAGNHVPLKRGNRARGQGLTTPEQKEVRQGRGNRDIGQSPRSVVCAGLQGCRARCSASFRMPWHACLTRPTLWLLRG